MKIETKRKRKTRAVIARVDAEIFKDMDKIRKKHGHTFVSVVNAGMIEYILAWSKK